MALPLAPALAQTTPPVLRVGATANDTYAQAYYADELGLFSKAGLNVSISTFANGAAVSEAVVGGALDVGVSNPVQIANAVVHGIPFVYFAGGGLYSTNAPTTQLAVSASSAIKSAKDFEGTTLAISALKDITNLALTSYLLKGGVDLGKVRIIEMPFAEMGPSLQRGIVSGAVISEPSLTRAAEAGQARPFSKVFDMIGPRFYISGWFTTTDWYKKNVALAKRYAQVMAETAKWANANHDKSAEILQRVAKLDEKTTKTMVRCMYAETLDASLMLPSLELAYRAKLLDRAVLPSELIAKA
jgi:NitT/TauT family transport system substrate-binding protein